MFGDASRFSLDEREGKVKKTSLVSVALGMIEEELRPIPSKGYPMLCTQYGALKVAIVF